MKRRLLYLLLSVLCFIACVLIVIFFSQNPFVRGFTGDILVILLIYFFVKIFHDFHPAKLATYTLVFAFTTEFLQYLRLIRYLGLEQNLVARIVIGSVFDPLDLIAYAIGTVLVYLIDVLLIRT
ncbi:MAG: DUF2809 domain-containing protein [Clostridia bacterium]|nr:DUF2809 domain-containing protein [Clostridia bacterium]